MGVIRMGIMVAIVRLHVVAVCRWRRHRHDIGRIVGRILEADLVRQVHYLQRHVRQSLLLLLLVVRLLGHNALRLRGHHRGQELLSVLQQLEVWGRRRRWGPDGHLLRHLLVFHVFDDNLGFVSQFAPPLSSIRIFPIC